MARRATTDRFVLVIWGVVIATLVLCALGLRRLIFAGELGVKPPFLSTGGAATGTRPPDPAPRTSIKVAGSGTNLPLARLLVQEFKKRSPGAPIVLYESIGTSGGVMALRDGAIDIALASRALGPAEADASIEAIPYAVTLAAVGVNPGVPDGDIDAAGLVAIYAGTRTAWSDGSPIVVLQRETTDSTHLVFNKLVPGFKEANEAAYAARRWRVIFSDSAQEEALQDTPGAVGLVDTGAVVSQNLGIEVLRWGGAAPTPESWRGGAWPFAKKLSFVVKKGAGGQARALVDFCLSPEGKELIRQAGYVPAGEPR